MPLSEEEFNKLLCRRLKGASEDRETGDENDDAFLSKEDAADLAVMRDALSSYKTETLAWAEKRSATMPSPHAGATVPLWNRAPCWAMAGVAAAACAAAAGSLIHTAASRPAEMAMAPNAQVLAADNQLLSSVDAALAQSGSTPTTQQLGLSSDDLLTGANESQTLRSTKNATD